jgi:hypothetical protein
MGKVMSLLIALSLWHCAHGAKGPENTASVGAGAPEQEALPPSKLGKVEGCCDGCPLALPGVQLAYAENGAGATMLFTTSQPSEEEELRRRVAALAEYHNRNDHQLAMLTLPHRAEALPADDGARIDLTPGAHNDADAFRLEVQRQVAWMQEGHCPPVGEGNECLACDLPAP